MSKKPFDIHAELAKLDPFDRVKLARKFGLAETPFGPDPRYIDDLDLQLQLVPAASADEAYAPAKKKKRKGKDKGKDNKARRVIDYGPPRCPKCGRF